jgi:tRNA A37 N6-isopentenylltransferase MiaA
MFVSPETINNLTKEELVDKRIQLVFAQDELDAERKQIDERLIEKMDMDAEIILEHEVKKISRTSFDVALPQAQELGATKMNEVVDTNKLKELEKAGAKLPKKTINFIQVKEIEG